jgi:hypothetical protein
MLVIKENKNILMVGCKIEKSNDNYNYYIIDNPTSNRAKLSIKNKTLFAGTKKECKEYISKLL